MGTGSYNCKELVFSMRSEKVIAGWTCHFVGFGMHEIIMSWERDLMSWERDFIS